MGSIVFKPFVGAVYGKSRPKIMALGESHYCADRKDVRPGLTTDIIKDLWDADSPHEGYKNTYTKFEHAMTGRLLTFPEKKAFWNGICFYNYVQSPMGWAREAPSSEDFAESQDPFFETLESLRPDYVIVWGQRLYRNLPNTGSPADDVVAPDGRSFETWVYTLHDGHRVKLLQMNHPSSGYNPDYWHEVIMAFLHAH